MKKFDKKAKSKELQQPEVILFIFLLILINLKITIFLNSKD